MLFWEYFLGSTAFVCRTNQVVGYEIINMKTEILDYWDPNSQHTVRECHQHNGETWKQWATSAQFDLRSQVFSLRRMLDWPTDKGKANTWLLRWLQRRKKTCRMAVPYHMQELRKRSKNTFLFGKSWRDTSVFFK